MGCTIKIKMTFFKVQFNMFTVFHCQENMGLWDIQTIAFCFYLHFTSCLNFIKAEFVKIFPSCFLSLVSIDGNMLKKEQRETAELESGQKEM